MDEIIKLREQKTHSNVVNKELNVSCIQCVKGVSESLSRALKSVAIRTVYKPYRTLSNIVPKPKDPTPADAKEGIM